MSKPIKRYRIGSVSGTVWEGDYQGKPTYQVSFQKSYKKKDGTWNNTEYFNLPDLRDLYSVVRILINKQVKVQEIGAKKETPKPAPTATPEQEKDNEFFTEDASNVTF